jgi:hypothetical protein
VKAKLILALMPGASLRITFGIDLRWACSLALLAALGFTGLTACDSIEGGSSVNALGCFTGRFELRPNPTVTSAGSLITLSTNAPGDATISHESWGTFGRIRNGRVKALYSVSAAVGSHGALSHPAVLPIQTQPLAGVGLPDHPFLIRVPDVDSGSYLVWFYYTVAGLERSERQRLGIGKHNSYNLCATIRVLN